MVITTLPEAGLGLSHNRNSEAARKLYDPIWFTQFVTLFNLPRAITDYLDASYGIADYQRLLMEHCMEVKGLPQLTPGKAISQTHQFSERLFGNGAPEKTSGVLEMKFSVNQDYNRAAYIYNVLRSWANLVYDPTNGGQGLKWEYAGSILVAMGGKDRVAWRNWFAPVAFITEEITEPELDYKKGEEVWEITAKFACDYFDELLAGMTGRYLLPQTVAPQNATARDLSVRNIVPNAGA